MDCIWVNLKNVGPRFFKFISVCIKMLFKQLAPVVQKMDNAIDRINHYPADSLVCFVKTYLLDSDLSSG